MAVSEYQQFLNSASGEVNYTLGCHPSWENLQLIVEANRYPEDGGPASIELSLTPGKARRLSQALLAAAWYLERKNGTLT